MSKGTLIQEFVNIEESLVGPMSLNGILTVRRNFGISNIIGNLILILFVLILAILILIVLILVILILIVLIINKIIVILSSFDVL